MLPPSSRTAFSKFGKAVDNYFMLFRPKNEFRQPPPLEVLQKIEEYALSKRAKLEEAFQKRSSSAFKAVGRKGGRDFRGKREGANRCYNPKIDFIKNRPASYTIPKDGLRPLSAKESFRPHSGKDNPIFPNQMARAIPSENPQLLQVESDAEANESISIKRASTRPITAPLHHAEDKENFGILANQRPLTSKPFSGSRHLSSLRPDSGRPLALSSRKVFGCIDFGLQTNRKPLHHFSPCLTSDFDHFEKNTRNDKLSKKIDFNRIPSRKPLDLDLQNKELPDKFYLVGFDYSKVRPESSKIGVSFRTSSPKIMPMERTLQKSIVEDKDLGSHYNKLAHFKRIVSADWNKGLGRKKERVNDKKKKEENTKEKKHREGLESEGRSWSGGCGWASRGITREVKFYNKEKMTVR